MGYNYEEDEVLCHYLMELPGWCCSICVSHGRTEHKPSVCCWLGSSIVLCDLVLINCSLYYSLYPLPKGCQSEDDLYQVSLEIQPRTSSSSHDSLPIRQPNKRSRSQDSSTISEVVRTLSQEGSMASRLSPRQNAAMETAGGGYVLCPNRDWRVQLNLYYICISEALWCVCVLSLSFCLRNTCSPTKRARIFCGSFLTVAQVGEGCGTPT